MRILQGYLEDEYSTTNITLSCSQDPSLSSRDKQNRVCLGKKSIVTVVIPIAQPPKPNTKISAKYSYYRRSKKQTPRTDSFDEWDDDDPDNNDYVE